MRTLGTITRLLLVFGLRALGCSDDLDCMLNVRVMYAPILTLTHPHPRTHTRTHTH